jgi:DNA topoisomerase I
MGSRVGAVRSATAPVAAARSAGLRYVNDDEPGIRRVKQGRGFRYIDANGKVVRLVAELDRIRRLAVPPAWTDVWICRDARGHIQATGRDAKGRKQYRYHAHWRQYRDETKFDRMLAFAAALPVLRRRAAAGLARPGLSRDKVLAAIVQLLEKSLIRIGNEEYVRQNNSFGLTTLRVKHVRVNRGTLRFQFRGKSGIRHSVDVNDRRLANVVRQCRDLPGQELFQYVDRGGAVRRIGSGDINRYVREVTGQDFSAKDFRTWSGTVLAVTALRQLRDAGTKRQAEKNVILAVEAVAGLLGNTRSVCRKSYVHPGVIDCYVDGSMMKVLTRASRLHPKQISGLRSDEVAVVALLKYLQGKEAKRAA